MSIAQNFVMLVVKGIVLCSPTGERVAQHFCVLSDRACYQGLSLRDAAAAAASPDADCLLFRNAASLARAASRAVENENGNNAHPDRSS